jgi:hypothetical protein
MASTPRPNPGVPPGALLARLDGEATALAGFGAARISEARNYQSTV